MGKDAGEKDALMGTKDAKAKQDTKKEEKKMVWPKTSSRKVKKTCMEAALCACLKLEDAKNMVDVDDEGVYKGDSHRKATFTLMICLHLLCLMLQLFVALMFNLTVAEAVLGKLTPGAINLQVAAIKMALYSVPPGALGPLQVKTCMMQRSHPFLGYLMLFIWFSMMLKEIQSTLELVKIIMQLPAAASKPDDYKPPKPEELGLPKEMKAANPGVQDMGKIPDKLDHMNFEWKLFALLFILLPHLFVSFYSAWVGMKFLAATGLPGKLLMKALALKFVLGFDTLIYQAFVSEQYHKYFSKCKWTYSREQKRNYFASWITTILKLCFAFVATGLAWGNYTHILVLREWCRLYFDTKPPSCLGDQCGLSW